MKKSILTLGTTLSKESQKVINGSGAAPDYDCRIECYPDNKRHILIACGCYFNGQV
ncbi:protein of unknown function [Tenacibaculum sp. 190524A02b]|uniref:Uncharacterized protein n=1 Tax=Tenacibaculum vairaonense TaxID=3137860 RepID=A0ABM9PK42_9FLAO